MSSQLRPVEPARGGSGPHAPDQKAAARRLRLRWLLPILVLAAGGLGATLIVLTKPVVETTAPEILPPLVRAATVEARPIQLRVHAQGTVAPRTETDLVAEVAGRVVWISPALVAGGFFEEGEPLLRLETDDYEVALERASAQLARTRSVAELAKRTVDRQRKLFDQGVLSDAALDDFGNKYEVAAAALRDARAGLRQAKLDLERTVIRSPYDGRVHSVDVDVGQYVTRGFEIATVYAVDYAEVRLPIPDEDLAHLGLGVDFALDEATNSGAAVTLTAALGGRTVSWPATLVRSEGELDARTRMVSVVARVDDPYGRKTEIGHTPLPVGLFVAAEIEGKRLEDVIVLPRSALRGFDKVLVVDAENRLRFRDVQVLRRDREEVVIGSGIEPGERVCLSPLDAVTDGMRVRVVPSVLSEE